MIFHKAHLDQSFQTPGIKNAGCALSLAYRRTNPDYSDLKATTASTFGAHWFGEERELHELREIHHSVEAKWIGLPPCGPLPDLWLLRSSLLVHLCGHHPEPNLSFQAGAGQHKVTAARETTDPYVGAKPFDTPFQTAAGVSLAESYEVTESEFRYQE